MGNEELPDAADDVNDRSRAAYASIPSLLGTWSDGQFDPEQLAEWLERLGENDVE